MLQIKDKVTGYLAPVGGEYDIATSTAIVNGALVKMSGNKVVLASTTETGDILGVALEAHKGSADPFNPRANGTKILVADSPTAVYSAAAPTITATGGTTTTIVSTDIDSAGTDDSFNGGYAKLISKGASSTNTDSIGKIYAISDYDASEDTLTIATAGGAVTAGDVFAIFPPFGFTDFNYDSTLTIIELDNDGQSALKVIGRDTDNEEIHLYAATHSYANENA